MLHFNVPALASTDQGWQGPANDSNPVGCFFRNWVRIKSRSLRHCNVGVGISWLVVFLQTLALQANADDSTGSGSRVAGTHSHSSDMVCKWHSMGLVGLRSTIHWSMWRESPFSGL
jgi:hypothetical protein